MTQPLNFQQAILKLHDFWAAQGCVIWEPYNVQVGAGTGNPATTLRVLGPEPWRVAYVEPTIRPDDGRYGQNPNRMQKFYQYQVILKPDPGNPQEIYLDSLKALGINPREHDIRFVEDNWESPVLGAWGLGWEVWLDGQEITQFTYFQQAGGMELNPVSVEITYGLERIVLALQDKDSAWDIDWMTGVTYHDIMFVEEVEHSRYYFEVADIDALKMVYDAYERESGRALESGTIISAYDYVLKCSHLFNVLDTRGAIGVTERAGYFRRMRDMTQNVATAYLEKREELNYPLLKMTDQWAGKAMETVGELPPAPSKAADLLLEIGVEELPAQDVDDVLAQLVSSAPIFLEELRLSHESISIFATPRRIVVTVKQVAPKQADEEFVAKGPPAERAFDADGKPTKAAAGFARGKGVAVEDLVVQEMVGGEYVTAVVKNAGRPATEVLAEALPEFIAGIKFVKSMRWNETGIAFSRPIRWLVALFGEAVVPFTYAGLASGNRTRGLRSYDLPEIEVDDLQNYLKLIKEQHIILEQTGRRENIISQITLLAKKISGQIPEDPELLDEVTNLIEAPTALRGTFDEKYLELPRDVLVTVMRKHQRYFPIEDGSGQLMPYFVAVRNGDDEHLDKVTKGNEHVLTARFADANFFYQEDIKKPLQEYLPRLGTLTFQHHLGSMLDKNNRVAGLVADIGELLSMNQSDIQIAQEAAAICKADLATQIVVELTSLQGTMGREYALRSGYSETVADTIFEHWLPRGAEDILPQSKAGILLALTDKLDSLVGLFAAGLAPKSTSDPYGLRRAALGIVQILIHHQIDIDLTKLVEQIGLKQPIEVSSEIKRHVMEFIEGRLLAWLMEAHDFKRDVLNAVLAQQASNPYRALMGIQELAGWIEHDNWEHILDNFARCVRITRSEPKTYMIDPETLAEPQEKALYEAYEQTIQSVDKNGNVDAFLTAFTPMVPAITEFFDHVMVHTEDEALRHNRLALLQAISAMQNERADLSELSGF